MIRLTTREGGLRAAFFWVVMVMIAVLGLGSAVLAQCAETPPMAPHSSVAAMQTRALDAGLDRSPLWAALLHLDQGRPGIADPGFLLSLPDFSPRQELLATLSVLWGSSTSADAVCRFPARYAWLQARLGLPPLSMDSCADLKEFMDKAPAQHMALVFASENLAQPSSMMGHLFLKVGGQDRLGVQREHAISFFTDVATLNLPKLFYDSMVAGKPGHFALSPYAEEVDKYVRHEQRTLWEYDLKLDDESRTLIQYHLLELKQARLTYFFHRYNCATLVKHVVALAAPSMLDQSEWATTPKDVLKAAEQARLLQDVTVHAPARWRVRAIDATVPAAQARAVRQAVQTRRTDGLVNDKVPGDAGFLSLSLASGYNQYLIEQGVRDPAEGQAYHQALEAITARAYPGHEIEASSSNNPVKSPQDSQWSLGMTYRQGQRWLMAGVLPISHTLADDNSQYFAESELRLFDVAWLMDAQSGRLKLDHLTIYAAKSLLPRDIFTGGWSGQFKLGLETQWDQALAPRSTWLVEGGLGATLRPWRDVDVYALLNGGLGWRHRLYGYIKPEVGAVVREVYGLKSLISLSHTERPSGAGGDLSELSFTQSKFVDDRTTLSLEARRRMSSTRAANEASVRVKRLF